jgi:hypothetical protein
MELFDKIKAEHKEFNDQMTGLVGSDPVSRREKVIALNTFVLAHQKRRRPSTRPSRNSTASPDLWRWSAAKSTMSMNS